MCIKLSLDPNIPCVVILGEGNEADMAGQGLTWRLSSSPSQLPSPGHSLKKSTQHIRGANQINALITLEDHTAVK